MPLPQPPGGGYFDPDDHLDDDLDTEEEPAPSYKSKKETSTNYNNCKTSPSFNHINHVNHNHKSFSPSNPLQPQHQELWKNTSGHLILYPGGPKVKQEQIKSQFWIMNNEQKHSILIEYWSFA